MATTFYQKSPPRLSVEIEPHHREILDRIPHGMKKHLFHSFIMDIGRALDKNPDIIYAIVAGSIKASVISTVMKEAEANDNE